MNLKNVSGLLYVRIMWFVMSKKTIHIIKAKSEFIEHTNTIPDVITINYHYAVGLLTELANLPSSPQGLECMIARGDVVEITNELNSFTILGMKTIVDSKTDSFYLSQGRNLNGCS